MSITAMRSKLKLKNLTDWKQEIFHWSYDVQACKPGCYSYVKGCVLAGVEQLYTGNLLTVVGRHTICTASQTNLQPVHRNGRQHLAKTIRLK